MSRRPQLRGRSPVVALIPPIRFPHRDGGAPLPPASLAEAGRNAAEMAYTLGDPYSGLLGGMR